MNFHSHTYKICAEPGCCNAVPPEATCCRDVTDHACEAELQNMRARKNAFMLTARRQGVQAAADSILPKPVNPVVPVDRRLDSWFAAGE